MEDENKTVEQEVKIEQEKPPVSPENEANWKKWREDRAAERAKMQEIEKQRQEEAKRAESYKAIIEAMTKSQPEPQQEQNSEKSKKEEFEEWLAERDAKIEKQRRDQEQKEFPTQLRKVYPDFDRVCNEENLDYLEFHHKEITDVLAQLPDGFDKWSKAYHLVKKMIPAKDLAKETARIQNNALKPQAMAGSASIGDTNKAMMNLSPTRKAENWQRMMKLIKSV